MNTCETCKYHIEEHNSEEVVCTCPDSDYLGLATDNKDFCEGYKEKQEG